MVLHNRKRTVPLHRFFRRELLFISVSILLHLPLMARVADNKVTINVSNSSLEKVIQEIKKQTGLFFLYESSLMQQAKLVSLSVTDEPVEKVLAICFKDQPLQYKIIDKTVVIRAKENHGGVSMVKDGLSAVNGGPATVKGRVINEKGEGIPSATVQVKGSSITSITDSKGEFTITVPDDQESILVITSVSYQPTEQKLNGKNNFSIIMPLADDVKMAELVVTPFGQEKREKETGYAIKKISGRELTQSHPTNFLNGLTGKVPGLIITTKSGIEVNPQLDILLRGIRSVTNGGSNSPLFVLDGTIMTFGGNSPNSINTSVLEFINNINPDDIEQVTVLRGANASTLYGPEGVNGVIIIETRKGKAGKTQINFSHSTSIQKIDKRYPKFQTHFGGGSAQNAFGDGIYKPTDFLSWGPEFTGGDSVIGRPDENGNVQRVPYQYTNERFKFFETGLQSQSDLSLSGGDNKTRFLVGMQYAIIQGMIRGDESRRATIRTNVDRDFGSIKTSINFGFTKADNSIPGNVIGLVLNSPAQIPLTNYKDFRNNLWADHNHYYNDLLANPYEQAEISNVESISYAIFGNFVLSANIGKMITITNRLGINYSSQLSKSTTEAIFYSDYAKANALLGRSISVADRPARLGNLVNNNTGFNNDLLLTFEKKINDFNVKILVGQSSRASKSYSLNVGSSQLSDPNIFNIGLSATSLQATESINHLRSMAFLGNFSIGYKDYLFAEINGRRDFESRLNNGKNNQTYYGINTSFILTDAVPVMVNNILTQIRIRAAVNKTAYFNSFTYAGERIFQPGTANGFPFGNLNSFQMLGSFVSRDINPEQIISQEYGLAIDLFQHKLKLDISYYTQLNNRMILDISIPISAGYNSTTINAGDFRNAGWEFSGSILPLFKLGSVQCQLSGHFSINDNKVISLYKEQNEINLGNGYAIKGQTAPISKQVDWSRDSLGHVIVDAITGLPSADFNPVIVGRLLPKYIGGVSVNLNWKNFSVSITGEYRANYYFNSGADFSGIFQLSAINSRQRFVFPNSVYWDGNKYVSNTSIVVNNAGRSFYSNLFSTVETNYSGRGDFWKIRELVLLYNIPIKKIANQNLSIIKRATVSVFGRNLYTFLPRKNIVGDPEVGGGFGSHFLGINVTMVF